MSDPKFRAYTLWLKWDSVGASKGGWHKYITVLNRPWPAENPIQFLRRWAEKDFPSKWGRDWHDKVRILPVGRAP